MSGPRRFSSAQTQVSKRSGPPHISRFLPLYRRIALVLYPTQFSAYSCAVPDPALNPACSSARTTGSNVIVAGTAIFGADDPNGVIRTLKTTVNEAQARLASK